RQIISQVSGRSTTVHRGRGLRLFRDVEAPGWDRYSEQGGIRYSINSSHPLIQRLMVRLDQDSKKALNVLLASISASLTVEMIYSDYSTHPQEMDQIPADHDVIEKLGALRAALWSDSSGDAGTFREIVRSTRLFERHMEIVDQYI